MLRDELVPPPTPLSHRRVGRTGGHERLRDMATEGPRCCVGVPTPAVGRVELFFRCVPSRIRARMERIRLATNAFGPRSC